MHHALFCVFKFVQTQDGLTALILAAKNGEADCVRLLLDCGADKDAKDKVHISFAVCTIAQSRYFVGRMRKYFIISHSELYTMFCVSLRHRVLC